MFKPISALSPPYPQEYSYDPDTGNHSIRNFYLDHASFNYSSPLGSQLAQRGEKEPFTLGLRDGVLRTNIYFQENMNGFIEFRVGVNDSAPGHSDMADVSVSNQLFGIERIAFLGNCMAPLSLSPTSM
jgi:hypothetical protein